MIIAAFLISICILAYISIGIYRSYALKKDIIDHPNQRSSHFEPIPHGGGVIFPILFFISLAALYFIGFIDVSYFILFIPPIFFIALVSFLDDLRRVAARYRFLIQLLAAIYVLVIIGGFPEIIIGLSALHWGWFGNIFILLAILWSINLYNFMDGVDGIAAVEALFVFGFGGYFIWQAGGHDLAFIIWSVASIVAGFLFWNKPPAKIFMGDVGSTFLGLLVALFAILGEKKYGVSVFVWMILYGVFWFDATATLIRRLLKGEKLYQAHRLHAFQRMQPQDRPHNKIFLGVVIINVVLAFLAFLAFLFPNYMFIPLSIELVVLMMIYIFIEEKRPMYLK